MNDEQPTQPLNADSWAMMSDKFIEPMPSRTLTDAELAAIRTRFDNRNEDMRSWGPVTLFHAAREVPRLLAEVDRLRSERDKMLEELQWYITDLGPEHYQDCDADEGDCYLCSGHVSIRDEWGSAKPIGEPR